ncbi:MAG TPA: hypothetical protein VGE01_14500 [Fimbriimonas sp.]
MVLRAMTKEDLSFVADALLSLAEEDSSAPCHTEEKLLAKCRLDAIRMSDFAHILAAAGHGEEYLVESECLEIYERAKLTRCQSEVFWLRVQGLRFEHIGRLRGHTKQGARQIFLQVLKKLARSRHVYPYNGLSDVYRNEVRRGRH